MKQWQIYIQPPRRGTSHKKKDTPCQDMAAFKENDEVIVAVLSDGLGQFEYSGIAATAITLAISTYLMKYDYRQLNEDSLKVEILNECKQEITKYSEKLKINVSQMDCTLLFIVLFKNGRKFIFGQLGDGAICIVRSNQGLQAIALNDGLKASSNLTKTVLSGDALDYFNLRMYPASDFVGFFLTTDGLENELYSKAGKVKKMVEWYFNLISQNDKSVCEIEIQKRWDELTSDEKFGFTDDMSLIAIVRPGIQIELPEDATWLCACRHRNRLESSRCEKCGKDFLKVYKGVNFKQNGGSKQSFFTTINADPQKELSILREYSTFPLEFDLQTYDEVQVSAQPDTLPLGEQPEKRQNEPDPNQSQPTLKTSKQRQQSEKTAEAYKDDGCKKKISGNLNIIACLLLAFIFGALVNTLFGITLGHNTKTADDFVSLQKVHENLQSSNDYLAKKIAILDTQISELKDAQNVSIKLPKGNDYYTFSNGDIYIGQLNQRLPNGTGVVYSSGMLMTGRFQFGLKNGDFYVLYNDGRSEVQTYDQDILIKKNK